MSGLASPLDCFLPPLFYISAELRFSSRSRSGYPPAISLLIYPLTMLIAELSAQHTFSISACFLLSSYTAFQSSFTALTLYRCFPTLLFSSPFSAAHSSLSALSPHLTHYPRPLMIAFSSHSYHHSLSLYFSHYHLSPDLLFLSRFPLFFYSFLSCFVALLTASYDPPSFSVHAVGKMAMFEDIAGVEMNEQVGYGFVGILALADQGIERDMRAGIEIDGKGADRVLSLVYNSLTAGFEKNFGNCYSLDSHSLLVSEFYEGILFVLPIALAYQAFLGNGWFDIPCFVEGWLIGQAYQSLGSGAALGQQCWGEGKNYQSWDNQNRMSAGWGLVAGSTPQENVSLETYFLA